MKDRVKSACDCLKAALGLERSPVGVKFLYTQEEYLAAGAPVLKARTPYCVMVRQASGGRAFKTDLSHSKCGGGTRALGLTVPGERFLTGEEFDGFGLYRDREVSRGVAGDLTFCSRPAWGVMTRPLEQYDEMPDVVILIVRPYEAMRILQGYTYQYGVCGSFKLAGNQAVCAECTAYPFETKGINLSLFCSGTRYLVGWKEEEMAVGICGERFAAAAEGVYRTVNGAETNGAKDMILARAAELGLEDPGIKRDDAYFMKE
ncbi:DUF169 domain-containing protein [Bacilliculturomica massiliensis]|uniref:DUF169 domain-containing protein n=1 Tax=Bacilliculturomica massiliensis TaxID=1917867 RepID=UPI00102FFBE1|nr:DUF169 domain-containing protein [Bacilliculturomica massiliensis]